MKHLIILVFLGLTFASCGQSEESTTTEKKTTSNTNEPKRLERVDEVTFLSFI